MKIDFQVILHFLMTNIVHLNKVFNIPIYNKNGISSQLHKYIWSSLLIKNNDKYCQIYKTYLK